ncbi:MAG: DUF2073 domain-containing protein [Candidatus Aenigmarchaeota archaeon]|nr:DUF2073 domain-containing protein [Candidatus Aenigmarchaeota archaeon]
MRLEMDFISSEAFAKKSMEERVKYIISNVKKNKIIVIGGTLPPKEEMKLVEETMKRIDEKFPGIEVCSLKKEESGYKAVFQKFVESIPRDKIAKILSWITKKEIKWENSLKDGITLIGPSTIIKKIKREKGYFKVLAEV